VLKYQLGVIIIKIDIEGIKERLRNLKIKLKILTKEIKVLYIASKRDDVPWYAKAVILLVVAYALSPIDLIPDFIPILGYLDDLVLLPLGIMLAIRLIPKDIISECREQSENIFKNGKPKNWVSAGVIIFIWMIIATFIMIKLFSLF